MHLADKFIKDKFLEDTQIFLRNYHIEDSISPLGALVRNWIFSDNIHEKLFELYIRHYKRNFAVLERLAIKENLDTERQVFNLVKEHINKDNIKLRLPHLLNLYISHLRREIVQTPLEIPPADSTNSYYNIIY